MKKIEITRTIAARVLQTIDAGLVTGMGDPEPGKMCVEAAVCYALGLEHSDRPTCVSDALRTLKIQLNDEIWTSPASRAAGLRRLGLAQLGSKGVIRDRALADRVLELQIRKFIPMALRKTGRDYPEYQLDLEEAAVLCETSPTKSTFKEVDKLIPYGLPAHVRGMVESCLFCNSRIGDTLASVYNSRHRAACIISDSSYGPKYEAVLAEFAEDVVQILISMGAPGCQWLDLAPLPASTS